MKILSLSINQKHQFRKQASGKYLKVSEPSQRNTTQGLIMASDISNHIADLINFRYKAASRRQYK